MPAARDRRVLAVLAVLGACAPKAVAPESPDPLADATTPHGHVVADPAPPFDQALPPEPVVPTARAHTPLPPSRTFVRGERAPVGLSDEDIAAYNAAQGDPHVGPFELAHAFAGDPSLLERRKGPLVAIVKTSMGSFECVLFEHEVPRTVANFVGLARGTRPVLDVEDGTWKSMRFYDGVTFHRVVEGFAIQAGDRSGTGSGDAGFVLADEPGRGRQHASAGTLAMAHRGKNTAGSQFYVTLAAAPHLDGLFTVFGECEPEVPLAIGRSA